MRNFLGVLGLALVVGTIFGGGVSYLTDWSSAEMVGGNTWTIVSIFGGGYLVYRAFRAKK